MYYKFFLTILSMFFVVSFSYSLKITEVYFDWRDEYIWLYSQEWFSWYIELSWAKNSNIKIFVDIKENEEIIIWDDDIQDYFSWFVTFSTWLSLSIKDTQAIDIDLIYSGSVVDNFYVPKEKVDQFDDKTTSFHKIFSQNNEIIEEVKNPVNTTWNIVWNPWYVQYERQNIEDNENDWQDENQDYLNNDNQEKSDDNTIQTKVLSCAIKLDSKQDNIYNLSFTWNVVYTWINWFIDNQFYGTWLTLSSSWWYIKAVWHYDNHTCTWSFYIDDNTEQTYNCNIIYQSFNDWKLDLDLKVSNEKLCWSDYKQVWNYSWSITTWTCNPYPMDVWRENQQIEFKIFSWENIVCKDTYNFFYQENNIETTIESTQNLNTLNCSIKIQWKDNYFFANDNINFITLVNDKEIQNSNDNYTCTYTLNWEILSNKCNPHSKKLKPWLHNIKLSIISNTWLTCQTTLQLNMPELSKDYIINNFNISDFQDIMQSLKSKYVDSSLKKIIQPLDYLYSIENITSSLNSQKLKQFVEKIKNKYKSENTLKEIFSPIDYLYKKEEIDDINYCAKLNSDQLKELTKKVSDKYKNNNTLEKIYEPIKFLYKQEIKSFTWNLQIESILPNPMWKDSWKEVIIISWTFWTWKLSVWDEKMKYILSNYSLTWQNYLFTWTFWLTNKWKCLNLYYEDIKVDSICYINSQEWKYITSFIKPSDDIIFKKDYIIVNNKIIENKPFVKLRKNVESKIDTIKHMFEDLKKENTKLKKDKEKMYKQIVKRLLQYNDYKKKYKTTKKELEEKNKEKYYKLIDKNNEIDKLNNIRIFLRSFIVHVKEYIPEEVYRQYLDNYKKVMLWEKVRF